MQNEPTLLGMPLEIREEIYAYLLPPGKRLGNHFKRRQTTRCHFCYCPDRLQFAKLRWIWKDFLALRKTSRQLYYDLTPHWYGSMLFPVLLEDGSNLSYSVACFKDLGPLSFDEVTNVHIRVACKEVSVRGTVIQWVRFEEEGPLPSAIGIDVCFDYRRGFHFWTGAAQAVRGWRKEGLAWHTIKELLDEWDQARPNQADYVLDEMSDYADLVRDVIVRLPYT